MIPGLRRVLSTVEAIPVTGENFTVVREAIRELKVLIEREAARPNGQTDPTPPPWRYP